MAPLVRRTWSPCAQTPIVRQTGRGYRKVSAIAALCVAPTRDAVRLYFRLHPDQTIDSAGVIAFLERLLGHVHPLCLLWDRLNAHRAGRTQAWLATTPAIHPTYFPPYAPDLNPVEYAWHWLKANPLANLACLDLDTLSATTRRHGRSLQRQPHLLRAFLQHAPLSLRLT